MPPQPPPRGRQSLLSSNQIRFTLLATFLAFVYRSLTQRAPLLFLSTPPALPTPHTCVIHHPTLLTNCEDLSHLPSTPYIFLSCDPARREWSHAFGSYPGKAPKGQIYIWNHATPSTPPILISDHPSLGHDFHPLGLSATLLSPDSARLFITNQAKARAKVDVLDITLSTAHSKHVKSIIHKKIHSPNGIAAVNATSFYLSNDMMMARRWSTALLLEAIFGIPGGQVLYVSLPHDAFFLSAEEEERRSGSEELDAWSIGHVCFANGLAWNRYEGLLYVASSTHGVYTYAVPDLAQPGVAHAQGFQRTPFAPDNLWYSDSERRLYVSGVSSISALATAMMSASAPRGPSWTVEMLEEVGRRGEEGVKREMAFRAVDEANRPLRVEERRWRSVFMDDGGFFGGVSTGGVVDGRYVGVSMVGEGVVVCEKILERKGSVVEKRVEGEKDEL